MGRKFNKGWKALQGVRMSSRPFFQACSIFI